MKLLKDHGMKTKRHPVLLPKFYEAYLGKKHLIELLNTLAHSVLIIVVSVFQFLGKWERRNLAQIITTISNTLRR